MTSKTEQTAAYDCRNIGQLEGKIFNDGMSIRYFESNGEYHVGGTHKKSVVEGRIPEAVAGLNPSYLAGIERLFDAIHEGGADEAYRSALLAKIEEAGEEPAVGKILVGVLSFEDMESTDKLGFYSGTLEEID